MAKTCAVVTLDADVNKNAAWRATPSARAAR
jgi:hypothetical protein